jgi:hypothetical protein
MQSAHGQFTIQTFNQVVYLRPVGSWNLECANAYVEALKAELCAEQQSLSEFIALTDLRYWTLGTPEALEAIKHGQSLRDELNLTKLADIYLSPKSVLAKVSRKEFSSEGQTVWRVHQPEEALEILKSNGVSFDLDKLIAALEKDETGLAP